MNQNRISDFSLLLARMVTAIVIGAHGSQKLFGWFDGYGFEGTMAFFTDVVGLPYIAALAIVLTESVGMILLLVGIFSRAVAAGVIIIMIGAIMASHLEFGFFMNWFGAQKGEGFEFHLLVIALALVVVLNGSGRYAIDFLLLKKISPTSKFRLVIT